MSVVQREGDGSAPGVADRAGWGVGHYRRFGIVLTETVRGLFANNSGEWAAAIAYYGLLSAFPLLLVGASLASLVVDAAWAVERAVAVLGGFIPGGGDHVERIVQGAVASRGRIGLVSGIALVWTGGRALAALTLALNAVCGDDTPEDAPRRFLVSLGLLALIGFAFACALLSGTLIDDLWRLAGALPGQSGPAFTAVRAFIQAMALLGAFFLIYWFVPRSRQDGRATLVGASAATLLFLAARPLFLFAIEGSETYQVTYGPLALAAILMVWAWVVAYITLAGGQLAMLTRAIVFDGLPVASCRATSLRSRPP